MSFLFFIFWISTSSSNILCEIQEETLQGKASQTFKYMINFPIPFSANIKQSIYFIFIHV
jgi:hypothetical protein